MRIDTNTDEELKLIHRPIGWFLLALCLTVVNLFSFASQILSGRNVEENVLYGSITLVFCLVMLRGFTRKSVIIFKASANSVEYSTEHFFGNKSGTLNLNEIEKITEIEAVGSDPICYRLALVTTNGIKIPLTYTYDNVTNHGHLVGLVNEWLRKIRPFIHQHEK